MFWCVSKWIFFFPDGSIVFFSDIHCENLVESLETKIMKL